MPLTRVSIPSPNYSSRNATVRLIVLHSSEGAQTYQSLGNYFANPANQVSSHVGIDDTPAPIIGEYVARGNKAWTAANANPVAVQAELCTPSGASQLWTTADWKAHNNMLVNTAAWIAEEAAHFNIPIVRLTAAQAQSSAAGVCQHSDLGRWGGGHVDCGPGFPIDDVIAAAKGTASTPTPPPIPEDDMTPAPCAFNLDDGSQQVFYVDKGGRLQHYYWTKQRNTWTADPLSTGWDADSALTYLLSPALVPQVWGVMADGKRAQCYWSGRQWITQPLA